MIRSLQLIQAFGLPTAAALGVGSELVVLVFEQDRRMYDFGLLITERDFFRLKHFMA